MDVLVFSHLRWDFVFQRPQHLMSRFAAANRVFFWEEAVLDSSTPLLKENRSQQGVVAVVPHLPWGCSPNDQLRFQRALLVEFIEKERITNPLVWYYGPLAIHFARDLKAAATVYDCMDELTAFRGAPAGLRAAEMEVFSCADLVFTGGKQLYEAKKKQHAAVHCFPSSIDRGFFATAREITIDPNDQASIPRPRLGFAGVIDERMDMELLREAGKLRPNWHFVMVGPLAKINESEMPQAPNFHWLGGKPYGELPSYMSGWDVALLPFARNHATRFISPTKTPEYLAAGLPVVSTSIADVVEPYGARGLVQIADTPLDFVAAVERSLGQRHSQERLSAVDDFLQGMSWDRTWKQMNGLVYDIIGQRAGKIRHSYVADRFSGAVAAD